jgi:peptide-methionine (S)-S-oxide reductase
METKTATLGGGCFWCLEPLFDQLKGVVSATPGYAGGRSQNPSYEQVCSGTTGHAEVCQVVFDPAEISYRDLLDVFFAVHDPTTQDRQGADIGSQYRSIILYHDPSQRACAEEVMASLPDDDGWEGTHIVTELAPFTDFYPAEDYHREYFARNPNQGYCRIVISPKVAKFKRKFADRLDSAR